MSEVRPDHHDERILVASRALLDQNKDEALVEHLVALVAKHTALRLEGGINLIAAEAPSSPEVRQLLSSDLGSRASGGAIGDDNRYFAGLQVADEIEALAITSLCELFDCRRADQRLLGGQHAATVVYAALRRWNGSKTLMSLNPSHGGDTSCRSNGPAGALGYSIHDIPMKDDGLEVDLDRFKEVATVLKPDVVSLAAGLNLFPFPVREMKDIIDSWEGVLYFDAAHQAGLIAGGAYPNPLTDGAHILSASSGKTFSGPQGGFICWNWENLTDVMYTTIFPTLTGTHQLNRVAALAMSCLEMRAFGPAYMKHTVKNAKFLARSLHNAGLEVLGAARDFTETHQVAVRVPEKLDGHSATLKLASSGVFANKVALPGDAGYKVSGVRFGLAEVTRFGMGEAEMTELADIIVSALIGRAAPDALRRRSVNLKSRFPDIGYCFI